MMGTGVHIEQNIAIERLPEYAGGADNLFVINEGSGPERVSEGSVWHSLPAVRLHRMFELEMEKFSFFDPISLEAQLELLTRMLIQACNKADCEVQ